MTKLLAVGDSHLEALRFAADLGLLDISETNFCIVPGATAVGLRNPNSATNALAQFQEFVARNATSSPILIHLGEVDCGFVAWWRKLKYGETVESQLLASLDAYKHFVLELRSRGFVNICITGASLPSLRDGVDFGEVANFRAEVAVSLKERTEWTLHYNRNLAHLAAELSCFYFDIASGLLNSKEGTVSDYFRNVDPTDHHLDKAKVVALWALSCNSFLRSWREHVA